MPPKKQSAWSRAAESVNKQRQNGETGKQENSEAEKPQQGSTRETQSSIADNHDNIEAGLQETGKEENHQSVIPLSRQEGKQGKSDSLKAGKQENIETEERQNDSMETEDKPTEKITLYLTWKQLDKLDMMALEYKRRTRKRTDHNKLLRMMVDKFDLEDLL